MASYATRRNEARLCLNINTPLLQASKDHATSPAVPFGKGDFEVLHFRKQFGNTPVDILVSLAFGPELCFLEGQDQGAQSYAIANVLMRLILTAENPLLISDKVLIHQLVTCLK